MAKASSQSLELPATAYAVLGILSVYDEELSAVEIKTRADFSISYFHWSPAVSHIRRELDRLRDLGLVEEREVQTTRLRSSLLYQTTDAGDAVLKEWVESLPEDEPVILKNPVLLRVFMAAGDKPDPLIGALKAHEATIQGQLDELIWGRRRASELGLEADPFLQIPRAVGDYLLSRYYAEIGNLHQLEDEIADITSEPLAEAGKLKKGERRPRHPIETSARTIPVATPNRPAASRPTAARRSRPM
jgi:DNA-binding PadR family transcriptional regulator